MIGSFPFPWGRLETIISPLFLTNAGTDGGGTGMTRQVLGCALLGTAWMMVAANCEKAEQTASAPASTSVPTIEVDTSDSEVDGPGAQGNEDY